MSCRSYLEEVHALSGSDAVGKKIYLFVEECVQKKRFRGSRQYTSSTPDISYIYIRSLLLGIIISCIPALGCEDKQSIMKFGSQSRTHSINSVQLLMRRSPELTLLIS